MKNKLSAVSSVGAQGWRRKPGCSSRTGTAPLPPALDVAGRAVLLQRRDAQFLAAVPAEPVVPKNEWEQNELLKCACVADVEKELAQCQCGFERTANPCKKREWETKIRFLNRLRLYRASHGQPD